MQVLIYTSPTCGPCRVMKPQLMQMAIDRNFSCLAVSASQETQSEFVKRGIRAVPTVVVLDGETEVARFTGQKTEVALLEFLKESGVVK